VRVIGIDLGERRIGLAISDATATLARPVRTLERGTSDLAAIELLSAAIADLTAEGPVSCVVVGLPTHLNGTDNLQTPRARKMVALLSAQLNVPVVTQDERLSSYEADQRLRLHQKDWRKRKAQLDAAAAG
jgi:putative Holliday junction resolvase